MALPGDPGNGVPLATVEQRPKVDIAYGGNFYPIVEAQQNYRDMADYTPAQLVAMGEAHEAFDLYRQAAERNHLAAQVEHARMQLYGVACDANPIAAEQWLDRAERGGSAGAASLLASIALGRKWAMCCANITGTV